MQSARIRQVLTDTPVGRDIEVKGWVRSCRHSKSVSFIDLNDGSCLGNLQVIADHELAGNDGLKEISTGCSLRVAGLLVESPAKGQEVELQARELEILGLAPEDYPLQKKRHSFEFLREIAHLRPRTNSLGAVTRMRSSLSFAVHEFFHKQGFVYIHTPIISTSDCEGAGETFTVTALQASQLAGSGSKEELWDKDFFGCQANLTVSGQLEAEAYALALGNVYTFGPTFRAENSNTSRHLAEFWMIEPEMAFCDLDQDIELAEKFLKYLVNHVLEQCSDDLKLFSSFIDKGLKKRLESVVSRPFGRLTYSEAVERLEKSGRSFSFPVAWGDDLQSEHERYLTEEMGRPLVVTDYPKSIKPFYMRENEDGKTVAAMDILFPGIGEIIGGSQREERYERLQARMEEMEMSTADYQWYLDLRKYGSAPHAGFGLGFERFIQFVTGMKNIREVIPFPRTPK